MQRAPMRYQGNSAPLPPALRAPNAAAATGQPRQPPRQPPWQARHGAACAWERGGADALSPHGVQEH
eukprot:15472603-Alexandrium_andersonii.AAC.1